jgi:hypothetical protein
MDKGKLVDPIPEEFTSYEEAAEFWDTHDTMDYPDAFRTVEVIAEFKGRRHEVEIDEDVVKALRAKAQQRGVTVSHLANELLRQQLLAAG